MKGVVFSLFIEMMEEEFSPEIADDVIESCNLESEGAYTSVGTYDHVELLKLVTKLSTKVNTPTHKLVRAYGEFLLSRFVELYPTFFENKPSMFDFLLAIENHVHVEVQKLYPDAELPHFKTNLINQTRLDMEYISLRPFADLAEGLIRGCADFYRQNIVIEKTDLSDGACKHVLFTIQLKE
nr:heme NO-binding domain-containing protein [Lelliottia steviae]